MSASELRATIFAIDLALLMITDSSVRANMMTARDVLAADLRAKERGTDHE